MLGHGHGHETAGVYDRVGQSSMTEPVPWIQALRKLSSLSLLSFRSYRLLAYPFLATLAFCQCAAEASAIDCVCHSKYLSYHISKVSRASRISSTSPSAIEPACIPPQHRLFHLASVLSIMALLLKTKILWHHIHAHARRC